MIKKRKKIATALCVTLLLFVILAFVPTAFAAETDEDEQSPTDTEVVESDSNTLADQWIDYVQNEIVPYIVLAVSAISSILLAILPVLKYIRTSAKNFNSAKDDVAATSASSKALQSTVQGGVSDIKRLVEDSSKSQDMRIKTLERKVVHQNNAIHSILQIVVMAFANDADLAHSGYAAEIARLGNAAIAESDADKDKEDESADEDSETVT